MFSVFVIMLYLNQNLIQSVSGVCRVKKLRETLVAVQQLDKNMSSLRSWLAQVETELSRPIVYETCDSHEIQRKLNQQQVTHSHTLTFIHGQPQSIQYS